MSPESRRRIEVFGSLRVRGPDFEVNRFPTRKVASLLGYLVVHSRPRHSKETLIELLWPGRDFKQGRNSLRNALSSLRKLLRWPASGPLRADKQAVMLDARAVDSDLHDFRACLQRAVAARLPAAAADELEQALAVRAAALLAESFEDWVLAERDTLQRSLVACREAVGEALLAAGQAERALALADQGCRADALDERAGCLALRACLQLGRFSAGLQRYKVLAAALEDELDSEPCVEAQRLAEALRSGGGQAARLDARAALPEAQGGCFGREQDVETLASWLGTRRHRLITLTGLGGVGKTRLALEVARKLCQRDGGRVVWVALDRLPDETRLPGLVRELLAAQVPAAALSHARCVVVLDGLEPLLPGVAGVLSGLLEQAPGLDALASSRRPLQLSGELVWPVKPLPVPEEGAPLSELQANPALQLLIERAQAARPGLQLDADNARELAQLCRRLDGHPQALEVAAAQLGILSPAQLLARCEGAPAPGDPVRGLLASSLEGLPAEAREILAGLSVFRAGFTLESGETVLAQPGLAPQLETLRRHGLIHRHAHCEPPRFAILGPLRRLLLEELPPERKTSLAGRHVQALVDRALEAEKDPEALQAELPDVRAALENCLQQQPQIEQAVQLITNLGRFWLHCGHGSEGRRHIERVLACGVTDLYSRGRLQHLHGVLSFAEGDLDDAAERLQEAVQTLASQPREDELARALRHLAGVESLLGQVDRARERFERAEAIEQRRGDRFGIAHTREGLGWLFWRDARVEDARLQWQRAADDYRRLDNSIRLALSLGSLGMALTLQGRHGPALLALEETLAIFEARTMRNRTAFALEKLGCLYLRSEPEKAWQTFQRCHRLSRTGERHLQILTQLGLARCERGRGELTPAWQRLQRILPRARLDQERGATAGVYLTMAEVARERGQTVRAAALYGSCLGSLRGLKHVVVLPACLEGLACLGWQSGAEESGRSLLLHTRALRQAWGIPLARLDRQRLAARYEQLPEQGPEGDWQTALQLAGALLSELGA